MKRTLVFTGSYSRQLTLGTGEIVPGIGKGITVLQLDRQSGKLTKLNEYPDAPNPTYLALDRSKQYLYANHELKEYMGLVSGALSAYKVDVAAGKIQRINTLPTGGTDACHVAVNNANDTVAVANFMSGSVCVFPRNPDGSIGPASCFLQHKGCSVDAHRQLGPHAHQICFDNQNRRVLVPDLGTDEVVIYDFDPVKGYLSVSPASPIKVHPGSGPRHCVFNRNGDRLYLINEMGNTIYVFQYDESSGQTEQLQCVPTVPEDSDTDSTTAAIRIHPNGKFLYGSNRGHNSLATYAIDPQNGLLHLIAYQSSGGKIPRDFDIDETGEFLIAGNQDSNNLVVFRINPETGVLTEVFREDGIFAVTSVLIADFD